MPEENYIPLSKMRGGQRGRVACIRLSGTSGRRLIEMGVLPGVYVRVVRRAPLGDPIEIRLRGYALSLRADDAGQILVSEEADG